MSKGERDYTLKCLNSIQMICWPNFLKLPSKNGLPKCNGLYPGIEKKKSVKNLYNLNKVCSLVNSIVPVLISRFWWVYQLYKMYWGNWKVYGNSLYDLCNVSVNVILFPNQKFKKHTDHHTVVETLVSLGRVKRGTSSAHMGASGGTGVGRIGEHCFYPTCVCNKPCSLRGFAKESYLSFYCEIVWGH